MIMVGAASPSTLDKYARGIEELVTLSPNAWGIISVADETMRAERWDICKEGPKALPSWDEVINQMAFGFGNSPSHW